MDKLLNKRNIISLIIGLLVLVSSLRVIDDFSYNYTTDAITSAAISYATARGINALVSMMQTTTLEAGIGVSGSIAVGELLDPLNDLIERFSSIMTIVLASLAGQKVILLISSHQLFQVLIAIFGIASILLIQFGKGSLFKILLRFFLVLVFLRFSLGVVVAMNAIVDLTFLLDQTQAYDNKINLLKRDMSSLNYDSGVSLEQIQNLKNEKETLISELNMLHQYNQQAYLKKESELKNEINEIKNEIEKKKSKQKFLDKINPLKTNETVKKLDVDLKKLELKLDDISIEDENRVHRNGQIVERLSLLDKKIKGEPDGLIGNFKRKVSSVINSLDFDKIERKINDSIQDFMALIALYLLKTIFFPFVFFYMIILIVKGIWRMQWEMV